MKAQKAVMIMVFILMCIGTFFLLNQKPEPKKITPFTLPTYDSEFPTKSPAGYSLQCSRIFEPVCAEVENIKTTFPNECAMQSKGATKLFDGSCEDQALRELSSSNRTYISTDEEICAIKEWSCEEGETPFSDDQGCGCEKVSIDEEIQASEEEEVTDQASETTTKEEAPNSDPEITREETILFEGCPQILSRTTCPAGYEKFEEAGECGCKK